MADPVAGTATVWQERPDLVRVQHRTVWVLVASQVIGGVGIGTAASMGALLAESVTSTEALAGIARTASTLGAAIFGLPLALLAGRRGRRAALGLGWLLAAVGGIGLVLSVAVGNVALLVLGMLLFGCGTATNLQSRYAAADLAAPHRRARTLSLVIWSTTVGSVLGPNLSGPGAAVAGTLQWPVLAGPFVIATVVLLLASVATFVLLRPDPLLAARPYVTREPDTRRCAGGPRAALRAIRASSSARLAFCTVVVGHSVMGAVMTMTPVHMAHHGASLTIVGMTISVHVFGMYALSPLVGMAADRFGRRRVIAAGVLVFLCSVVVAGASGSSTILVTAGLFLLGVGWSCSLVAGSTLLGESVPAADRPTVQGVADTSMNAVAALAAGMSGALQSWFGFAGLNTVAGLLVIPIVVMLVADWLRGRRQEEQQWRT